LLQFPRPFDFKADNNIDSDRKDAMKRKSQTSVKEVIGKAADAAGLIKYQARAIVSRTLIKKPTGTVTLFAFAAGQEISEHIAPFDALAYVLDGEAEISISGKPQRLVSGEMMILPADKPHALKAIGRFKMMLVMIREKTEKTSRSI
jgi:quercetin dioxygenase-like cupin family protein